MGEVAFRQDLPSTSLIQTLRYWATTGSYHQGEDQKEMEHYEEACCLQDPWQINSEKHQGENQRSWWERKLQNCWEQALQNDFGITSKLHQVPRTWATEVVFVGSLYSQSQCHDNHEVIKKIFGEMPSSKEKAVQLRNFLIWVYREGPAILAWWMAKQNVFLLTGSLKLMTAKSQENLKLDDRKVTRKFETWWLQNHKKKQTLYDWKVTMKKTHTCELQSHMENPIFDDWHVISAKPNSTNSSLPEAIGSL